MTSTIGQWLTIKRLRKTQNQPSLISPAPHLRKSNQSPTPSEVTSIQTAISQAEQQLVQLQATTMSSPQRDIMAKWDNIVRFIQAERAILSPLRRLPAELLTEVFTYLVNESDNSSWNKPPFMLTRVCHRWRDVALSEPYLWRRVPKLRLNEKTNLSTFVGALKIYLARSRGAPLILEIYAPFKEYYEHPVLNILIEHSTRWENLRIQSTYATIYGLHRARGKLPLLRKLDLDIWSTHSHQFQGRDMNAFAIAPMLTDVTLSGIASARLKLPWKQIYYYEERPNQSTALRYVLCEGTQLRKLSTISNAFATFQGLSPPVRLDFLQSIDMGFGSEPDKHAYQYVSLIESIVTPSLEHLRVASFSANLQRVIHSLVTRSFCNLQTLAIHGNFSSPGSLTSLLRGTPLLTELEASNVPNMDIVHLIASPDTFSPNTNPANYKRTMVPLLRRLILRFTSSQDLGMWDISALSELARSRCELPEDYTLDNSAGATNSHCRRLELFRIVIWGGVTLDFRKAIEGWRSDMLDLCQNYPNPPLSWPESIFSGPLHENNNDLISISYAAAFIKSGVTSVKYAKSMDKFFTVLENYAVDKGFLQNTSIHHSIYDLTRRPSQHIPGEQKYKFRKRSQALLDKWKSALLEHLESCHWEFRGRCSLIYVASDDKFRQTPQAINIIFGEDEREMDNFSLLWPGRK